MCNLAVGAGPTAEQPEAEVLGTDDPAGEFRRIMASTLAALNTEGALQVVANTPFGEMPLDSFIGIVWVDPLIHAWDVADAAGIPHGIDQASAQAAFDQLSPVLANLRGPGLFGDEQQAPEDDAVTRLIAFTGRSSVQS